MPGPFGLASRHHHGTIHFFVIIIFFFLFSQNIFPFLFRLSFFLEKVFFFLVYCFTPIFFFSGIPSLHTRRGILSTLPPFPPAQTKKFKSILQRFNQINTTTRFAKGEGGRGGKRVVSQPNPTQPSSVLASFPAWARWRRRDPRPPIHCLSVCRPQFFFSLLQVATRADCTLSDEALWWCFSPGDFLARAHSLGDWIGGGASSKEVGVKVRKVGGTLLTVERVVYGFIYSLFRVLKDSGFFALLRLVHRLVVRTALGR